MLWKDQKTKILTDILLEVERNDCQEKHAATQKNISLLNFQKNSLKLLDPILYKIFWML